LALQLRALYNLKEAAMVEYLCVDIDTFGHHDDHIPVKDLTASSQ
jgi:hypothetical protein